MFQSIWSLQIHQVRFIRSYYRRMYNTGSPDTSKPRRVSFNSGLRLLYNFHRSRSEWKDSYCSRKRSDKDCNSEPPKHWLCASCCNENNINVALCSYCYYPRNNPISHLLIAQLLLYMMSGFPSRETKTASPLAYHLLLFDFFYWSSHRCFQVPWIDAAQRGQDIRR